VYVPSGFTVSSTGWLVPLAAFAHPSHFPARPPSVIGLADPAAGSVALADFDDPEAQPATIKVVVSRRAAVT
jgi:hypothetical protein